MEFGRQNEIERSPARRCAWVSVILSRPRRVATLPGPIVPRHVTPVRSIFIWLTAIAPRWLFLPIF